MSEIDNERTIPPIVYAKYTPSPAAWQFHKSSSRFRFLVWGVKSGKCLHTEQGVLMADGSVKEAADLEVGDKVCTLDERSSTRAVCSTRNVPTTVTAIEKEQDKECIEVTFRDRTSVFCSSDHRFPIVNPDISRQRFLITMPEIVNEKGRMKPGFSMVRASELRFGNALRRYVRPEVLRCASVGRHECVHISVNSPSRCFLLENGILTHNTEAGAWETTRAVLAMPNSVVWVVAPTYANLQEAQRKLMSTLSTFPGLIKGGNKALHEIYLSDNRMIQCRSAADATNLRGPNVDFMWIDEAAFMSEDAYHVARERLMATSGSVIFTTTPDDRNWLWTQIQSAGIPSDFPNGVFEKKTPDGGYFVSHYPTHHFPWTRKTEIEALKKSMTKWEFQREIEAKFSTANSRVFGYVEKAFCLEPRPADPGQTVMGLDLARHQDFTAAVVMDNSGRTLRVDRWSGIDWTLQRARIVKMAQAWKSVVCVDGSNVGSVIEEDLRVAGLDVRSVDMNSPEIKRDLIHRLQMAFELGGIKLTHPKSDWASDGDMQLYRELCWYEARLTRGKRLTFSAPKGLTDDLVIALALCQWGRVRGVVSGGNAADCTISSEEWKTILDSSRPMRHNASPSSSRRLPIFGGVAGRGRLFGPSGTGRFWG